jgi:hypothetical protein
MALSVISESTSTFIAWMATSMATRMPAGASGSFATASGAAGKGSGLPDGRERCYAPKGHVRAEVLRLAGTTEPIEARPVSTVNGTVEVAKALATRRALVNPLDAGDQVYDPKNAWGALLQGGTRIWWPRRARLSSGSWSTIPWHVMWYGNSRRIRDGRQSLAKEG